MNTVELLLHTIGSGPDGSYAAERDHYRLEVAAGRPGSVCFTLRERGGQGARVIVAEGFSLNGRLVYDQRRLPASEVERIIRRVLDTSEESLAIVPAIPSDISTLDFGLT